MEGYRPIARPADLLLRLLEDAARRGASEITVQSYGGGISNLRVRHDGQAERFLALPSMLEAGGGSVGLLSDIAPYCIVELQSGRSGEGESGILQSYEGRIVALEAQSCRPGMEVSVTNLYFNLPDIYRKYKNPAREKRYCLEVIRQVYLCYGLSMRWLDGSGPEVYIPAAARFEDRVEHLFRGAFASHVSWALPGGRVYLLSGPEHVSPRYGICMMAGGALQPLPALLEAYLRLCEPYRQDRDVPAAVFVFDAVPDEDDITGSIAILERELPPALLRTVRQEARAPGRTAADRPRKVTVQGTVERMKGSGAHAHAASREEGLTVRQAGGMLLIESSRGGKRICIPLDALAKHLDD